MKIKYIIYRIKGEYINEIGYFNALHECASFDTEEQALKTIDEYVNASEYLTIMKVYCKK